MAEGQPHQMILANHLHGNQGLQSTTDAQFDCELDIFHLVTGFTVGDEESPACLKLMEEGGKGYKAEEHIHLTRGGRRYSWDIPPDEKGQNAKDQDGFWQQSVRGRRFSWDKPPNVADFYEGLMNIWDIGGRNYRWDSYRAPSHEKFISL